MTWFFERESQRLRYEIRREFSGPAYEVVISNGGKPRVEKLDSPSKLLERSQTDWNGLIGNGWRPLGPQLWPAVTE